MKIIRAITACVCLNFFCSCATQKSIRPNLPSELSFNETAGRGVPLFVTLTLETGEKLLFFVDTGCPETVLDKSLESKLGERLGTKNMTWGFYEKRSVGIYKAPKLYLNNTQLLTGDRVKTDEKISQDVYGGVPVMGILGMDCLRHYCIQLDFAASKIRFLDSDRLETRDLGKSFPLNIFFGGVFTDPDILDMKSVFFRLDTGLFANVDFLLKPKLFQWELREQKPFGQWEVSTNKGDALFSKVAFNGETYTNFVLTAKGTTIGDRPLGVALFTRAEFSADLYTNVMFGESFSITWPTENLIGLRFFARNLVTFNFPKRTMYLKHEGDGRSLDNNFTITPGTLE